MRANLTPLERRDREQEVALGEFELLIWENQKLVEQPLLACQA